MENKKKLKSLLGIIILLVSVISLGEIVNYQFNKYEDMTIEEVMEKRYRGERPYVVSENYYLVLYEGIDYDIFYIDEEGRNIIINTSVNIRRGKMKFSLIDTKYTLFDSIIENNGNFIFDILYAGDREGVIIYDNEGEWDAIRQDDGDVYFFKVVIDMSLDYVAYIDYGDGHIDEISGKHIMIEFE